MTNEIKTSLEVWRPNGNSSKMKEGEGRVTAIKADGTTVTVDYKDGERKTYVGFAYMLSTRPEKPKQPMQKPEQENEHGTRSDNSPAGEPTEPPAGADSAVSEAPKSQDPPRGGGKNRLKRDEGAGG